MKPKDTLDTQPSFRSLWSALEHRAERQGASQIMLQVVHDRPSTNGLVSLLSLQDDHLTDTLLKGKDARSFKYLSFALERLIDEEGRLQRDYSRTLAQILNHEKLVDWSSSSLSTKDTLMSRSELERFLLKILRVDAGPKRGGLGYSMSTESARVLRTYLITTLSKQSEQVLVSDEVLGLSFRWACHQGDLDLVKFLFPLLSQDASEKTVKGGLYAAIFQHESSIVQYLLESPKLDYLKSWETILLSVMETGAVPDSLKAAAETDAILAPMLNVLSQNKEFPLTPSRHVLTQLGLLSPKTLEVFVKLCVMFGYLDFVRELNHYLIIGQLRGLPVSYRKYLLRPAIAFGQSEMVEFLLNEQGGFLGRSIAMEDFFGQASIDASSGSVLVKLLEHGRYKEHRNSKDIHRMIFHPIQASKFTKAEALLTALLTPDNLPPILESLIVKISAADNDFLLTKIEDICSAWGILIPKDVSLRGLRAAIQNGAHTSLRHFLNTDMLHSIDSYYLDAIISLSQDTKTFRILFMGYLNAGRETEAVNMLMTPLVETGDARILNAITSEPSLFSLLSQDSAKSFFTTSAQLESRRARRLYSMPFLQGLPPKFMDLAFEQVSHRGDLAQTFDRILESSSLRHFLSTEAFGSSFVRAIEDHRVPRVETLLRYHSGRIPPSSIELAFERASALGYVDLFDILMRNDGQIHHALPSKETITRVFTAVLDSSGETGQRHQLRIIDTLTRKPHMFERIPHSVLLSSLERLVISRRSNMVEFILSTDRLVSGSLSTDEIQSLFTLSVTKGLGSIFIRNPTLLASLPESSLLGALRMSLSRGDRRSFLEFASSPSGLAILSPRLNSLATVKAIISKARNSKNYAALRRLTTLHSGLLALKRI